MKILVLGSGAGSNRDGSNDRARTPSSIAVSADGHAWVLLNASADLGPRPPLWPQHLRGVVLLDAQPDHVTGLLSLRDGPPIRLYATPAVFEDLTTGLPILPVLAHCCGVQWHLLPVAGDVQRAAFHVEGLEDLQFEAVAISNHTGGHTGGHKPARDPNRRDPAIGDTIALRVHDRRSGMRLFYAPALGSIGPDEFDWLHEADCVIADGAPALFDLLCGAPARRKVLIHRHGGPAILDDGRIEVAYDGMEIQL